jgi:hypothetical protein
VIGDGRLGLLQHRGKKARVRRIELKGEGGLMWRELTERGGHGNGGFDTSAIEDELRHWSG